MSQFPADPIPADQTSADASGEADPFDELARLISGDGPAPAMRPSPQPAADYSDDYDIQAAMEGRAARSAPAPLAAVPEAPAMPVFDPSAPVPAVPVATVSHPASALSGVHHIPTRGPLARVAGQQAQDAPISAPSVEATDESPLDAVFDLTALRAAFERNAAPAAVEAIPATPVAEPEPVVVPQPSPEPVAQRAPTFAAPPAPRVPENEHAEIVQPPVAFAPQPVEAPAPVQVPTAQPAANVAMFEDMRAMMQESPVSAPPSLPEASFEIDLESELEAALMSDLAGLSDAPAAPAMFVEPAAAPDPMTAYAEPVSVPVDAAPTVSTAGMARPATRNGRRRALAAAGAFCLLGSGAAIAWTIVGDSKTSETPVILADAGPTKMKPDDAGGIAIPNRDTALFKEGRKSHQSALRSGSEQPVEVAMKPRSVDKPLKVKTSLKRALPQTARKVRTVVVKPDGSIVSGETVVGAVAPRVVKSVPVASKPTAPETDAPVRVVSTKAKPVAEQETKPANDLRASVDSAEAPVWDTPATAKPEAPKAESMKPVVAAKPAKAKDAPARKVEMKSKANGGYVVQISSRRSAEGALRAFDKLKRRYGKVLAGRESDYQKTEIAGKGTFYRVRVLAESKGDARSLCSSLKRAGGSCFVTR